MQAPADPLPLTDGDRQILTRLAASQTASLRLVLRARVLLMAGDGMANSRIAERTGLSVGTVRTWRARYAVDGVAKLGKVASGRGRKASISQAQVDEIVHLTLHTVPEGETHWSCRTMAKWVGLSPATVQRVWSARGLKPHQVKTFKLSNDRRFEEKLIDVVGLYLDPPEKAIVLCMDELCEASHNSSTQSTTGSRCSSAGGTRRPSTRPTSTRC